jgi:squalene-associated FAD-dependent desaturase
MKKCIIIGGGLAGLSAAVHLTKNNYKVTLLEASPKLGGRAYSFYNGSHGHYIDNGQHIMMGCYQNTLELLKITDALDEIIIQDNLRVPFVSEGGKEYRLEAGSHLYPFNLSRAIWGYKALTVKERFSLLAFFVNNLVYDGGLSKDISVNEWLRRGGQSDNTIKCLWDILAVGILNSPADMASAKLFRGALRQVFLTGNKSTKIVFAKSSLSETFADKSRLFIEKQGGEILLSQRVREVSLSGVNVTGIKTVDKEFTDFDFAISAVPLNGLNKIEFNPPAEELKLPEIETSPILSVHLWLKENPFREKFYGLIGAPVHWLFNNGTHITLVTSAAFEILNDSNEEIISKYCFVIKKYFPYFNASEILDSVVVREKNATFLPTTASNPERKNFYSPLANFAFAGDWTDTKLPATIEGAIKSGKAAAERVMAM